MLLLIKLDTYDFNNVLVNAGINIKYFSLLVC